MKKLILTCEDCGEAIKVGTTSGEVYITMLCQKCGSGRITSNQNVRQYCQAGHLLGEGNEAIHNCKKCPVADRTNLRKLVLAKKEEEKQPEPEKGEGGEDENEEKLEIKTRKKK